MTSTALQGKVAKHRHADIDRKLRRLHTADDDNRANFEATLAEFGRGAARADQYTFWGLVLVLAGTAFIVIAAI